MIVNEPERRGRLFFFIWTGILFVGIAVMLYPKVGKLWNAGRQSRVVDGYERSVEKLDVRKEEEMIAQTRAYNVMLLEQNNPVPNDKNADSYGALLNMTSDGVMGYLEIPEIRVKLPIYHGTGDFAICNGAGHVEGSSFPIGGKGTHAVLSSHRGLPGAKLFSDLDKLEEGDVFYLHVLDEVLAYKVDQIKVVLPEETQDIGIVEGKDYCTLVTCTPYAINTHRLLVRGERTEYIPPEELAEQNAVHEVQSQTITKRIVDVWPWLVVSLLIVAGVEGSIFLLIVKRQRSYGDVREKRKKGKRSSRSCNKTRRKK